MNLAELLADLEQRAATMRAVNAMVKGADVYEQVISQLRELDDTPTRSDTKDRLIKVKEAAKRIGMSPRYIYANKDKLSFVRKNGGRSIRCSERALERWMAK